MASAHPSPDLISSVSDIKPVESDNLKEQSLSIKTDRSGTLKPSQDAAPAVGHSADVAVQPGSYSSHGDQSVYPPNIYAPQPQSFYYRGYDNPSGEWDEYSQFVNTEGIELGSPGIYTGYGYNAQMPFGPYSPVTPPLPSIGGDTQLYSSQQFPFSGTPYYQQLYSPNPGSHTDLTSLGSLDQQGNGMLFSPRPGYYPSIGTFGRGNVSGNSGNPGFRDFPQNYDGFRSGGVRTDWKSSDRHRPLSPLSSTVSPQSNGRFGSFGQDAGMAFHQHRSIHGSGSNSSNKGYINSGYSSGSSFGGSPSISNLGGNGRSWFTLDNMRQRGRGAPTSLCNCNGTLDILSEQNRGPRASKPKSQILSDHTSSVDSSTIKVHVESYNKHDFVTEFENAKFFIIKSYSEDNVHKSIKYGIWASTPNGNRKLDTAYNEAKEIQGGVCPVFLLFSVNASAQFCGVAEMVGPVDFEKSVDYWQQDKWSGQFPVKWHIIKDVPNSQFRHIVLENNDNKPVTNSRDTQEVKLDQGIELMKIFKNYENDMSILDDFDFYEDREKAMQERKAKQQQMSVGTGATTGNEHNNNGVVPLPSSEYIHIKQMTKSFAEVVSLEDSSKDAASASSVGPQVNREDSATAS